MASNITQIGDAIQNLSLNFTQINQTDLLTIAIRQSNADSNNWLGIILFLIFCASTFLYIYRHRNSFNVFDQFGLSYMGLSVFLDIGIYLLIYEILAIFQLYMFVFIIFYVIAFFSIMGTDSKQIEEA